MDPDIRITSGLQCIFYTVIYSQCCKFLHFIVHFIQFILCLFILFNWLNARALLQLDHDAGGIGSDVPESFLSSESRALRVRVIWNFVESESSHDLMSQSRVNVESYKFQTSPIYILAKVHQWIFSGYRSASGPSVAISSPVDLQWL